MTGKAIKDMVASVRARLLNLARCNACEKLEITIQKSVIEKKSKKSFEFDRICQTCVL